MPVPPPSPSPSGTDAADRALDARPADDPVSAGHPSAPRRPARRRWLARIAGILAALALLAAVGLGGLWAWSGSDQSLATLLRQAARHLPAGQALETEAVTGSLRHGGRIGRLRWHNESLAVELRGIDIGWRLGPLLQRTVAFGTVHIADVEVARTGPAPESEPLQPLQGLTLPVQVDLPFRVDRIRWAGPPETVATALAGRYRYDGADHRLDIDGVQVAQGDHDVRLNARLQLQGAAPMALDAAVNARIGTPVPGSDVRLTVQADATAKGTLATEAARLAVAARVHPRAAGDDARSATASRDAPGARPATTPGGRTGAAPADDAMQATLQATVAPWATQPVLQADARFRALDIARLYPDLPETRLDGQVTVLPMAPAALAAAAPVPAAPAAAAPTAPAATGWQIDADLRNALPGPWDRQRLPVESLKGRAAFDGRLWDVPGMVVALGGGTIDLAGRFGGADAAAAGTATTAAAPPPGAPASTSAPVADAGAPPAVWQGRATLARISPAALHTRLDPTPIGGTVRAQTAGSAIDFDAALQPDGTPPAASRPVAAASGTPRRAGRPAAAAPSPLQALRLRSAVAQGRWDRQVLDLRVLRIRTQDADLQGELRVRTAEQAGSGKITLALPGGQATVEGAMAPTDGQGTATVRLDDAARVVAWLQTLPGVSETLAGTAVQGAARLDARWNGGWRSVQQRLDTGTLPAGARDLTLQATLTAPRLDARLAAAAPAPVPAPAFGRSAAAPAAARPGTPPAAASATASAALPAAAAPTVFEVRDLRAELSGSLRQMDLALQGTARAEGRRLALQARGSGGMDGLRQFRAALASLSLRAEDPVLGGPWTLQLGAPLTATIRTGAAPAARAATRPGTTAPAAAGRLEIEAGAGRATLAGPAPGTLSIDWEPLRYLQDGAARRLRSAGRLQGLPMAWLDALSASGARALKDYGIQGNLVFDGDWDIDAGDSLRAKARLARRSGDLRVQTGGEALITRVESSGPTVTSAPAGPGTATAPTAPGAAGAVANPAAPKVAAAPAARTATPEPTTSAGLRAASLEIDAQGDAVAARLDWDSERAGQVRGEVRSRVARDGSGWTWPADAPLAGTVKARMPRIGIWSVLAPPGWRVQGTLDADIAIAGTRTAPQWSGTLQADDLGVRSVVDGIELREGRLRAALRGTRIEIEEFRIAGARGGSNRIAGYSGSRTQETGADGGLLTARGSLAWDPAPAAGASGLRMDLQAQARALRLSARSDRQVTVSGDLRTRLDDGRLVVRGALRTDRAVIILPDESTPSLGSDVVVRSAAKDREAAEKAARAADREAKSASSAPQTAKPPDIVVSFDLGDDFAVQGYGLTTQLTGQVEVRSDRGLAAGPQVTGEIRTARGRYRAYGQQLDIETGIIRFNGPYDNPSLDILALRPNITVRAGVRITGTALSPQVRLYSEPALTDAETLSWVVLGRSTANGGAEAALLQQAALAFLSGSGSGPTGGFASKLGLDEVGFKGPGSGEDAASAALTFGKRLSRNLYVTYERSLSGTLGTLYIFYDLTRRFTLRGQAGVKSGLDLIYTLPYD